MEPAAQFREIIATYRKFDWTLKRVLLSASSARELGESRATLFGSAEIVESAPLDALWFARPSPPHREAWELRFVGATQFALFETFEQDEPQEEREELRREMEAQLIDRMSAGVSSLSDEEEEGDED